MSKTISNKGNKARKGKLFARQTVRLGWRRKKRIAMIDALQQQLLLEQAGVKAGEGTV